MNKAPIPLISKADAWMTVVIWFSFGAMSIWILASNLKLGLIPALLIGWFVYAFFGPAVRTIGLVLKIDNDRLLLLRKGGKVWDAPWPEIREAMLAHRLSATTRLSFLMTDGACHELDHMLQNDAKENLYAAISEHLPPGVQLLVEQPRYRSSRKSYAVRASIFLGMAFAGFGFSLWAANTVSLGVTLPFPSTLPFWILIFSLAAFIPGLMELFGYLGWKRAMSKPRAIALPQDAHNLMAAIAQIDKSEDTRFAYPAKIRALKIQRELLKGWIALGLAWLLMGGAPLAVLLIVPDGEKPIPLAGKLFLGGLAAFCLAMLTSICLIWRSRFITAHREIDSEVVIENKRLFLIRDGKRWPAEIVVPPSITLQTRDSSGFLRSSMAIEAGGEKRWLDPASMLRVEES